MKASAEIRAAKLRRWRENPNTMANEEFGFCPDKWQAEALAVFPSQDDDKKRLSLQACAGPGKSALIAIMAWNFLTCYVSKGEHPKGAAVSVTWDNLQDNLWPEMAKWMKRSEFLMRSFEWTKTRIFARDHPETWFLSARSWPKTANADQQGATLSGMHARYVAFFIDESGEIPTTVLKAAEQALSNCEWGKIVQAGNPTSHEGMLYTAATVLRSLWYIISITGDPDDKDRSPRIDIEWAKEQIRLYGRDDPWVMSYILGKFPPSSINSLLSPEEVQEAQARHLRSDEFDFAQKRIGVDIARDGDDRTVIFPRQGRASFRPAIMRNSRPAEVAARVALAQVRWNAEHIFLDDTGGWAGGVYDQLQLAGHSAIPINFSGKAIDPRYHNKRAEMWFEMAKWVKMGGALPRLSELVPELSMPQYTFRNARFLLEPKENIKKRLGTSPDLADALALTFALPEVAATHTALPVSAASQRMTMDYDPFEESRL